MLQVNCIVFDKTGTLTIGKPVVVTTKLFNNMSVKDFYELVAAAEASLLLLIINHQFQWSIHSCNIVQ